MSKTLGWAEWRQGPYTAVVEIVREHPNVPGILLVRGVFVECWARDTEVYPRSERPVVICDPAPKATSVRLTDSRA